MPRARQAAIAGAMTRLLLAPEQPCSPACGLRPATAIRGRAMPNRGSSRAVSAIVASSDACVSARGTSASGDVDRREHHAQRSEWNIIATCGAPGQVREQIGVAVPRQAGQPEALPC